MSKIIAGIDEVGRGPLAGPLVISLVICPWDKQTKKILKGVKDSKKISPKKREDWVLKVKKSNLFCYKTTKISNKLIDKNGLSYCLKVCIKRILKNLPVSPDIIYLDGYLKAPEKYKQKSIIKGDEKIPIISIASIFAKVYRDKIMVKESKKYCCYCFDCNKGYGTKKHIKAIKKYGTCDIHRISFLKKII